MSVQISLIQASQRSLNLLIKNPDLVSAYTCSNEETILNVLPKKMHRYYDFLAEVIKSRKKLELGTQWGIVHYIYDDIHRIRALSGKHKLNVDETYYKPNEVEKKSKAMAFVSNEKICQYFEMELIDYTQIYRFGWAVNNRDQALEYAMTFCNLVKEFYWESAQNSNAIIIMYH